MARKVHLKAKFLVNIGGIESAAFQQCSELSVEAAKIEYHEGGSVIPIKEAGLLNFSDVTLQRGTSGNQDFYNWIRKVWDASMGPGAESTGLADNLYKRDDAAIVQKDRDTSQLRAWALFGAWPTKFVAGEWDNSANEVVIEQLTLTYDYFVLET